MPCGDCIRCVTWQLKDAEKCVQHTLALSSDHHSDNAGVGRSSPRVMGVELEGQGEYRFPVKSERVMLPLVTVLLQSLIHQIADFALL